MTAAEGEGSLAESGPGAPGLGHRSDGHLSRPRMGGGDGSQGGCTLRPEPESGAERQRRVYVWERREGTQEKGVSHGRAPSRAPLEPGVRSPALPARSAPQRDPATRGVGCLSPRFSRSHGE